MKKIGITVLGVAVAAAFFFVFSLKQPENTQIAQNEPLSGEIITLYREFGDVFYTNPGSTEMKLSSGTTSAQVFSGSEVRTEEGSGYILFPDNSMMSIDKNTTLVIEYSKDKVSILQTLGNTYHRVKTLESGQQYEVRTPGTLAAVRGTKFAVYLDGKTKKAKVKVTESKVNVKKLDSTKPLKEDPVVLEEVDVPEGAQVDVPDASLQVTRPMAIMMMKKEDRQDGAWMERNEIVDKATERPETRREFIQKMIERSRNEREGMTDKERMEVLRERVQQLKQEMGIEDKPVSEQPDDSRLLVAKQSLVETEVPKLPLQPTLLNEPPLITDEENLPPLDPNTSDSNDPFVLEFDRRYEYWFPIYEDKLTLCSRVNPLTPEILKARLLAFETNYKGIVPNKDGIFNFLRSAKAYCASLGTDNRVLDEEYTTAYPF